MNKRFISSAVMEKNPFKNRRSLQLRIDRMKKKFSGKKNSIENAIECNTVAHIQIVSEFFNEIFTNANSKALKFEVILKTYFSRDIRLFIQLS